MSTATLHGAKWIADAISGWMLPDKAELELGLPNSEVQTVVGPKVMTACCKLSI